MNNQRKEIKDVSEIIKSATYVVALTGAGVSVESGIPPFRGNQGLWQKYRPEVYATVPGIFTTFLISPKKIVNFVSEITETILNASPSKGHLALAEMEREGYLKSIITQNIDNLHQKAGSRDVIELHGNIFRWYCTQCSRVRILSEEELRDFIHQLKEKRGRVGIIRCFRDFSQCECGERLRPSVVLFGEVLPQAEFERAEQQVHKCDLLLLIGTSAIVSPASNLPYEAKRKDATLVEINTEQTQLTTMCDFSFQEKAGKVLHEIVRFLL